LLKKNLFELEQEEIDKTTAKIGYDLKLFYELEKEEKLLKDAMGANKKGLGFEIKSIKTDNRAVFAYYKNILEAELTLLDLFRNFTLRYLTDTIKQAKELYTSFENDNAKKALENYMDYVFIVNINTFVADVMNNKDNKIIRKAIEQNITSFEELYKVTSESIEDIFNIQSSLNYLSNVYDTAKNSDYPDFFFADIFKDFDRFKSKIEFHNKFGNLKNHEKAFSFYDKYIGNNDETKSPLADVVNKDNIENWIQLSGYDGYVEYVISLPKECQEIAFKRINRKLASALSFIETLREDELNASNMSLYDRLKIPDIPDDEESNMNLKEAIANEPDFFTNHLDELITIKKFGQEYFRENLHIYAQFISRLLKTEPEMKNTLLEEKLTSIDEHYSHLYDSLCVPCESKTSKTNQVVKQLIYSKPEITNNTNLMDEIQTVRKYFNKQKNSTEYGLFIHELIEHPKDNKFLLIDELVLDYMLRIEDGEFESGDKFKFERETVQENINRYLEEFEIDSKYKLAGSSFLAQDAADALAMIPGVDVADKVRHDYNVTYMGRTKMFIGFINNMTNRRQVYNVLRDLIVSQDVICGNITEKDKDKDKRHEILKKAIFRF